MEVIILVGAVGQSNDQGLFVRLGADGPGTAADYPVPFPARVQRQAGLGDCRNYTSNYER